LERLFVDFLVSLTRTKRGNVDILVMVGAFSKCVFFRAVRKISTKAVCDSLEDVFHPAYGTPSVIVTDNARVFRCRVFKDLCFWWGMTHITTTPRPLRLNVLTVT
jgi:hypothetical protein